MADEELDEELALALAVCLQRVIDFAMSFSERNGSEPLEGSVAHGEMAAAGAGSGIPNLTADDVYKTYSVGAGIWLPTVTQYVLALVQLYKERMALYGYQVVARSAVETSSKVRWILDPTIDLKKRLSRYFIDQWVNVEELRKIQAYGPQSVELARMHWRNFTSKASSFGFQQDIGRNDSFIGYNGERVPEKTKLVREFLASLGWSEGDMWYRYVSAIAHSTSYAIIRNNRMIMTEGENRAQLDPIIPRETIINVAVLTSDSYLGAVWNHASLFGFDDASVKDMRMRTRREMLELT